MALNSFRGAYDIKKQEKGRLLLIKEAKSRGSIDLTYPDMVKTSRHDQILNMYVQL
jgi:hypothetical protein